MATLSPLEQETVQLFKRKLHELFGKKVVEMRLFGSRARGQGDEDSDLDLLVLLENPARSDKSAILDLACDLSVETGILLSPLVMSRDHFQMLHERERRLAYEIEKEGILL